VRPNPHWLDRTLRLWELGTGACLRSFEGHTGWVTALAVTPDGRFALSGSADKTLRLWELGTGACLHTFEGHTHKIHAVAVTPDGRFALSLGEDNTLRLWELDWELDPTCKGKSLAEVYAEEKGRQQREAEVREANGKVRQEAPEGARREGDETADSEGTMKSKAPGLFARIASYFPGKDKG
jgi:hypothetical protein